MLAGTAAPAQETDWADAVAKACEHKRYGMRRAVAGKIAAAGDAAVPAVRAYAKDKGADALPLLLVDAIAQADTQGEAVVALLEEWARDREFYWRAQALGGLARRKLEQLRPLYLEAVRDPSHLFRIEGAHGLHLLDPKRDQAVVDGLIEDDPDPRVRLRLAGLLTENGDRRFAGVLVAALGLSADFLGDPWGQREAERAARIIGPLVGDGLLEIPARDDLRAKLRALGFDLREPAFTAIDRPFAGGLAIRSCRNGDFFLRWTTEGELLPGLLPTRLAQPAAEQWTELAESLHQLTPAENAIHGRIVCDYLELVCGQPPRRLKCAPGALPSELQTWLPDLAAALAATPIPELADELSGRLAQFATPADKTSADK